MPDQSIELIADLKLQKPTTAERQIREIERNLFKGSGRAGEPLGRLTGKVSEFDKSLEAANARVLAFGASAAIITTVTTALTQMVVQSIRVEKVLLDINVLLGQSSSSLSAFSDSLFEVAKNTGQSFFDVAEAAKEFSRQGLGVQETLSRTADAMILTRLTGLDLVKSVEQLTASVNQFSKEGITTADVINRLANVDAKFAVSAKDLSEGLSRAGSVAQDAGASFNELIALVTAVQQRTARGGAVIGNALKTIFTRVSRSDTLDSLEKLGIGVRDLEGNTLPAIRILSELSQKYDEMSSSQRAFTSELVGGGYQINIVKSLFDDLGRTVPEYAKALDVAGRSTDEAYQRNELLNKSFASLANEAGQNLTKLAASFGSLTFGPALKNIFSVINGAGDSIDGNSFLEAGAKVGKGLITGIGDFIGGPGLIYLIALIGKLGKKFGTFAKDSLTDVLSIGAPNAKILDTQKGIVDLVNNEARAHDIVNNALLTQVQKEQQLILLIKEKVAAQAAFKNETLALSTSLVGRGVAFKPSTGQFKTKAGGHMPLPISSVPQEAIQREIVGAKQAGYNIRASDVRVMRASIDGKSTTVVYNNKEKVIHDYMGSGEPAIIPPTGRISSYSGGYINAAANPALQKKFAERFQKAKRTPLEGEKYIKDVDNLGNKIGTFFGLNHLYPTSTTVEGSIQAIKGRVTSKTAQRQLLRLTKNFDHSIEQQGSSFSYERQNIADNLRQYRKTLGGFKKKPAAYQSDSAFEELSKERILALRQEARKFGKSKGASDYLFRGVSQAEIETLKTLGQTSSLGNSNADNRLGSFLTSSFGKSAGFGLGAASYRNDGYVMVLDKKRMLERGYTKAGESGQDYYENGKLVESGIGKAFPSERSNTIKSGRIEKDDLLHIVDLKTGQLRNLDEFKGADPKSEAFSVLKNGILKGTDRQILSAKVRDENYAGGRVPNIANYPGGIARPGPSLTGTFGLMSADVKAKEAFRASVEILSKELGIPVNKIASTVINQRKSGNFDAAYSQSDNRIEVNAPGIKIRDTYQRLRIPALDKLSRGDSLGQTAGSIISHEYFHNAYRANKKAALGFAKENDLFIPRDKATALEYLEKVKGYKNPAKEYKSYAVEEALATQFGKVIGFTQHAGGHMPDYKNFAAVPKIPKTIYRGVNSKYGDSNRGAGSLGIANKLVATIGKGNYSDNAGIAKVFGDKTISQNTSKIKPGEVLQMSSYADVVGLYKKYEQRLPAGLASVIKNTTGAEQLGHIQNAGAQLASVLREDGYKMISAPLAAGDANVLGKRGLQGQMYIPLAGGYVNASGGGLEGFHATKKGNNFNTFKKGGVGFHFANDRRGANSFGELNYGDKNYQTSGYNLNIKNPLEIKDLGHFSNLGTVLPGLYKQGVISLDEFKNLAAKAKIPANPYHDPYESPRDSRGRFAKKFNYDETNKYSSFQPLRKLLRAKGFDGLKYNARDAGGESYVAFYPNQIKSSDVLNPDFAKRSVFAAGGSFNPSRVVKQGGFVKGANKPTLSGMGEILSSIGIKGDFKNISGIESALRDKSSKKKLFDYLKSRPISVSSFPDKYFEIGDGNHRKALADLAGIKNIPSYLNAAGGLSNPLNAQRARINIPKGFQAAKSGPKTIREKLEDVYARAKGGAQRAAIAATPYADKADDVFGFMRGMMGFSGGYMNAALGFSSAELQGMSKKDLLTTAQQLGIPITPEIKKSNAGALAKLIGSSKQHKQFISQERRVKAREGSSLSSSLATTRGFQAQLKLTDTDAVGRPTKINRITLPPTEAQKFEAAENNPKLNPGVLLKQSPVQTALAQAQLTNPSAPVTQRSSKEIADQQRRAQKLAGQRKIEERANKKRLKNVYKNAERNGFATSQLRPVDYATTRGFQAQFNFSNTNAVGAPIANSLTAGSALNTGGVVPPFVSNAVRPPPPSRPSPVLNIVPPRGPGLGERLSSGYKRATNFKGGNGGAAQGAFALSFAAPLVGGVLAEQFGSKDQTDQRSTRKIQGSTSAIGAGAATAAVLVGALGPLGVAIGLGVAAIGTYNAIIGNSTKNFEDLNESLKLETERRDKVSSSMKAYADSIESLSFDLTASQRKLIDKRSGSALSGLDPKLQKELLAAGEDPKKIQEVNAKVELENQRVKAKATLPVLAKSIQDSKFKDGGFGAQSFLGAILDSGKDVKKIDRESLSKQLIELKDLSKRSVDIDSYTFEPTRDSLNAKKQLLPQAKSIFQTLGAGGPSAKEFFTILGKSGAEEQKKFYDSLANATDKTIDNIIRQSEAGTKFVEARKDNSKELDSTRNSIRRNSLREGREIQTAQIRRQGSQNIDDQISAAAISTLESRNESAQDYRSAPTNARLEAEIAIYKQRVDSAKEIARLEAEREDSIKLTLAAIKDEAAQISNDAINNLGADKEKGKNRLQAISSASGEEDILSALSSFRELFKDGGNEEQRAPFQKLLEVGEKQKSALDAIKSNTKDQVQNAKDSLNVFKVTAEQAKATKIELKALSVSMLQFNAKALALNGPQTAGVTATAQKSVDEGLAGRSPLTDPAKLRAQALRYANGPEDKANKQEQFRQQDLQKAIAAKAAIEDQIKNDVLPKPEETEKKKRDQRKKLQELFDKKEGPFDESKIPKVDLTNKDAILKALSSANPRNANGPDSRIANIAEEISNNAKLTGGSEAITGITRKDFEKRYLDEVQGRFELNIDEGRDFTEKDKLSEKDRKIKAQSAKQSVLDKYKNISSRNDNTERTIADAEKKQAYFESSAFQSVADAQTATLYKKTSQQEAKDLLNQLPETAREKASRGGYENELDSYDLGGDVSKARVLGRLANGESYKDIASPKSVEANYRASISRANEYGDILKRPSAIFNLPNQEAIDKEANSAYEASLAASKPLTIEEVRKNRIRDLAAANTTIGAQGIVKTVGAGLSPFLSALDKGDYNAGNSFVKPGVVSSISSQINAGQFGQVQKRLEGIAPTLNSSGQAQIRALIPTLQAGAERLRDNPGNQLKAAEEAAGEELRPVEITDETIEKLKNAVKEGTKEGAGGASGTTIPTTTVSVTIQGSATAADGNAIGEAVASKIASITEFLSKKFDYAEVPKAVA